MPFIPVVLLLAWQVLGRSASFALGWATALFFGQVPGNRGRILSIVSLMAAGWIVLVVGAMLPLAIGLAGEGLRVLRSDSVQIEAWQLAALVAAALAGPLLVTGLAELFEEDPSLSRWLRRLPISYPIAASLGVSVLLMFVITPVLAVARLRRGRTLLQLPLVVDAADRDQLVDQLAALLDELHDGGVTRRQVSGPRAWPMRTIGFAARHLLGTVVRGEPDRLLVGDLDVTLHATNLSIIGPEVEAHQARAALSRELAFASASLTWSESAQQLERRIRGLYRGADGNARRVIADLEHLQGEIDCAELRLDEWNLLYRMRLQAERAVRLADERGEHREAPGEGADEVGEPETASPAYASRD